MRNRCDLPPQYEQPQPPQRVERRRSREQQPLIMVHKPPAFLKKILKHDESQLDDMDGWTKIMLKTLVPPLIKAEQVSEKWINQPVKAGKQETNTLLTGDTKFVNLAKEVSCACGDFPLGQWAALTFTQKAFPLEDIFVWIAEDDVEDVLEETQLNKVCPPPRIPFENPTTDDALTRIAFYGLGSHRLEQVTALEQGVPNTAVFKIDLLFMNLLDVRPGFARYGACVYFDADQKALGIRNAHEEFIHPTDGYKWEVAKYAWRSSLLTLVTAVDHLYNLHFFVAAQGLRASTEGLAAEHPIKRALQPFLFRTSLVNNKAGTALLPKWSILHRVTAFTWKALSQLAKSTYKKGPEWKEFQSYVTSKGDKVNALIEDGKLPFYQDGLELYTIYKDYWDKVIPNDSDLSNTQKFWHLLQEYTEAPDLKKALTRQHLLETLATFCFHVTAQHELVGTFAESVLTPLHSGFRITHNAVQSDKQSFIGGKMLLSLTSLRTPPLKSNFDTYWQSDQEKERWQSLQSDLKALEQRILERNKSRKHEFHFVNPAELECAVSV